MRSKSIDSEDVTKDKPSLCRCPSLVHMQVTSANAGRSHFENHIVRVLNFWQRNIFDRDAERAFIAIIGCKRDVLRGAPKPNRYEMQRWY